MDKVGKDAGDAVVRGVIGTLDEAEHVARPGDWTCDFAESLLLLLGRLPPVFHRDDRAFHRLGVSRATVREELRPRGENMTGIAARHLEVRDDMNVGSGS